MAHQLTDFLANPHEQREFHSILEYLNDQNVFSIDRNEDGTFLVKELCDHYFSVDLSKEQLLALADEIRAIGVE